jgi:hypothetical protein
MSSSLASRVTAGFSVIGWPERGARRDGDGDGSGDLVIADAAIGAGNL